jgi:hypothetical protein
MLPTALRKAAILISTLDERSADALLDQMDAEQAAKVRSALVELNDVAKSEEQQVLAEFLQQQNSPALAKALHANESDVELEISSASIDLETSLPQQPLTDAPPVQFLASVAADQLARVLRREQPQTIAAVIAHLSPEQSAGVLEHLPPDLATESLERLATLEPVAPPCGRLDASCNRGWQPGPKSQVVTGSATECCRGMDFRQRERVLLQPRAQRSLPGASESVRDQDWEPGVITNACATAAASALEEKGYPPRLTFAALTH